MKYRKGLYSVLLIVLSLLIYFSEAAMAQTLPDSSFSESKNNYRNIIKIDILSPVIGMVAVYYEHCLGENTSAQMELRFADKGIIITSEFRFYLSNTNAPQGIYVAPWLRFGHAISSFRNEAIAGGGILVGAQMVKKRVSVDAFVGPAVYGGPNVKTLTVARLGLILGYAF